VSDTTPVSADSASPTPAYVIGLGNGVMLRLSACSVLLCFLAAGVFSALTGEISGNQSSFDWLQPVLFVAVYFSTVVAHELVHGLFFRIFGGSPHYGAGAKYFLPYFYATSSGEAFSVRQMMVIGLAPLVVLSPLAVVMALLVPALAGYMAVVFVGNTAGAVGDLWMTNRLRGFLSVQDATVVDLTDGMAVHSGDPAAAAIASALSQCDKRPAGFFVHWTGAALAVLVFEAAAALVGPALTDSLLIGPRQLPLMEFTRSSGGFSWSFSLAPALVAGLIFAVAARLFSRGGPGAGESPVAPH